MGIGAFVLGVALAIWTASTATLQSVSSNLQLPFADVSTLALSVGGYLLTPILVFTAYVWDRSAQLAGLRDRNFGLKPRYSRALQIMAIAATLTGVWHVLNIAYTVSGA